MNIKKVISYLLMMSLFLNSCDIICGCAHPEPINDIIMLVKNSAGQDMLNPDTGFFDQFRNEIVSSLQ